MNFKKIVSFKNVLFLILVSWIIWISYGQFYLDPVSKEFYNLIDQNKNGKIDLSNIKSVDWDELVFWPPYSEICEFKLQNIGSNCRSNSESENYLLLIKNHNVVAKIKLLGRMVKFENEIPFLRKSENVKFDTTQKDETLMILNSVR